MCSDRNKSFSLTTKSYLMKSTLLILLLLALATPALAQMPRTPSPAGATAYFITPEDGAEISGPVTVKFGLKGMGIAPAGIDYPDSGHHHLLINVDQLESLGMPIPTDDRHRHFGKGQTEVTLDLEPGTYTLQIVLGDKNHVPHDPPVMSEKITVTVLK
jgi:Domain of unknown function (DUF4399)